jgi:Tfp pilus assembly protein PilF
MSNFVRVFFACILIVIALSVWSAVAPSHLNWGMHLFAFYSLPVQIIFLLLSLFLLIPAVTTKMTGLLDAIVAQVSKLPLKIIFVLLSAVLVALWLSFPSRLHLLGDGVILLRSIPGVEHLNLPIGFRNQPLVWLLYKAGKLLLSIATIPTPPGVYFLIDIISGIAFVGLIFWWMGKLERPATEKVLLGALVLFCGGFQFFFGYVENYVTQYVFTFAFAATGWFALEKKVHIVFPVIIFAILIGLNLGSAIFAPALLYLLIRRMEKNKIQGIIVIGVACVAAAILMSVAGFNLWLFMEHFLKGSPDFLPLLSVQSGYFPYPMFSFLHILDWLNLQALIVPTGLIVPVLILISYRERIQWKNPVLVFLAIMMLCGFAFTWIINSALGFARDWDLFSSFLVPLIVLNVYLLQLPFKMDGRRFIMAVVAAITFLHIIPFIGINADEQKHLSRVEMLNDTRLLSVTSRLFYYEALANQYYDSGQYEKARGYYEQYQQYDTVNPRILANMTQIYRKLGMKDAYFRILLRTTALGNPNPVVFSNLGVEYADRGDTAKAIEANMKCLAMDSAQVQAHTNLAVLYLNTKRPALAVVHAAKAISLGVEDPMIYRIEAKAYVALNDYKNAVSVYDEYLNLVPGDSYIRNLRDRIKEDMLTEKH